MDDNTRQARYQKSLATLYGMCALFSLMWTVGFFIVIYTPAAFIYGIIGNMAITFWVNFAVFIILFAWFSYRTIGKFKRDIQDKMSDSAPPQ